MKIQIKPVQIPPGNIFSGDKTRAVFTNPTELAFRKGNLKHHYPIEFRGRTFADAEAAYQHHKRQMNAPNFTDLQDLCTEVLAAKLHQYPALIETIRISGGQDWIHACSHIVHARTAAFARWEGHGLKSPFIRCLAKAYQTVT